MTKNNSPLSKYYRQPQIYVKLPTGKDFYDKDVMEETTTGEHAVLPMTATDEIAFKTPDALMNGQATVDVIQSCIPDIKDAWRLANYDLDTVLIAIRIATYGERMEVRTVVPVLNEKVSHELNLPQLLESVTNVKIKHQCKLDNGLTIDIKPLTYKQLVDSQLKTFEQQRIYAQVSRSEEMAEEEKTKRYADSFKVLTELNNTLLLENIKEIGVPDGSKVTDRIEIQEFLKNADAKLMKELENHLAEMRMQGSIKPVKVSTDEELIKKGAPASYEVPVTFDSSNFFV